MSESKKKSIAEYLGKDAEKLLNYTAKGFPKDQIHLPGPDFVDRIMMFSDRRPAVLRNFQSLLSTGRLRDTGYVSILPVDQGIEHSAGASFAPNPIYFDSENIVKLAIEGGCNAVASTLGVLGSVFAQICASDSLHHEAQSQRVSYLSEQIRSDHVWPGRAGE